MDGIILNLKMEIKTKKPPEGGPSKVVDGN
jgi:hypothetical protein